VHKQLLTENITFCYNKEMKEDKQKNDSEQKPMQLTVSVPQHAQYSILSTLAVLAETDSSDKDKKPELGEVTWMILEAPAEEKKLVVKGLQPDHTGKDLEVRSGDCSGPLLAKGRVSMTGAFSMNFGLPKGSKAVLCNGSDEISSYKP